MTRGWTLRNHYAGQAETVEQIDLTWGQRTGSPGPTSVTLTFRTSFDLKTLHKRFKPSSAFGVLSRNGVPEIADFWRHVRWQPVDSGAIVEVMLAPSEVTDRGVFPPVSDYRPDLSYQLPTGNWIEDIDAYQEHYDHAWRGPLEPTFLTQETKNVRRLFPNLAEQAEGKPWPWVYGAPGTSDLSGSPAYMIDAQWGHQKFMIAGHRVTAATVTIRGPSATSTTAYASDAAIPVHHTTTTDGSTYAYVLGADFTDVDNARPDAAYYTCWTGGEAQPGGAGDVLVTIVGLATVPVDLIEMRRLAPVLNSYRLAGYVDNAQPPTEFLRSVLLPILPVSFVSTSTGLRPLLAGWFGDDSRRIAGHLLVDGASIVSDSVIEYDESDDDVASLTLEYGYHPGGSATAYQATASGATSAIGRVATAVGHEVLKTYSVWEAATAQRMALDQLRARAWRSTKIRCVVADLDDHDTGGRRPLTLGTRVQFTSERFGYNAEPGRIEEVERDGNGLTVAIYLDDNPLTPR